MPSNCLHLWKLFEPKWLSSHHFLPKKLHRFGADLKFGRPTHVANYGTHQHLKMGHHFSISQNQLLLFLFYISSDDYNIMFYHFFYLMVKVIKTSAINPKIDNEIFQTRLNDKIIKD